MRCQNKSALVSHVDLGKIFLPRQFPAIPGTVYLIKLFGNSGYRRINIDSHSLKMHSAITQSSKNEKVVLIDGIEGAIRLFYVKQPVSL